MIDDLDCYEPEEIERYKPEPWQLEALKMNPSYTGWGPGCDYMWIEGSSWNSEQEFATWSDFGPWSLDDLNECVSFYFAIDRDSKDCDACEHGYTPEAKRLEPRQPEDLTDADFMVLRARGRVQLKPLFGLDAIDRGIVTKARCERAGVAVECPTCDGHGEVWSSDCCRLTLTLWWLHPRKGASRGLRVLDVRRDELPEVKAFLVKAAKRNAERFAKVLR
jgi:hypothetical protein